VKRLLVILMLLFPLYGIAKEAKVQVVYKDTVRVEWTYEQFENIMKASEAYLILSEIEKKNQVIIELKDDPWKIVDGTYTTEATVKWIDDKQKPLKTITIQIQLKDISLPDPPGAIEKAYTNTAKVGFPITIILCIILGIL